MRYASTSSPLNEMKSYSLLSPDPSVCAHWLSGVCEYLGTSFLMLLLLHNTESNIYLTWVILFSVGYVTMLHLWTQWYTQKIPVVRRVLCGTMCSGAIISTVDKSAVNKRTSLWLHNFPCLGVPLKGLRCLK
jgi:hypothetical protein